MQYPTFQMLVVSVAAILTVTFLRRLWPAALLVLWGIVADVLNFGLPDVKRLFIVGPAAVVSDAVGIVLTRLSVRRLISSQTAVRTVILLLVTALVPACLVVCPLFLALSIPVDFSFPREELAARYPMREILLELGMSNVYSSLVAALFAALSLAFLLHNALWELAIQRPLYALKRYNVIGNHKLIVASAGIALITAASPRFGTWLVDVIGKFGIHLPKFS